MARRRFPTLLIALAWVPAPPMFAQLPEERAAIDSMRGALARIDDSVRLISRERERIEVARRSRDDPMIHMELGLLAFRLGEVTSVTRRYDDAAGEFEWAAELRPDWAYAWYHLGLAELAIGESRIIPLENIRQVLGLDALSKAARAFARAASADPAFSAALVDLAATALRQRIAPRLAVAQGALRIAAGTAAGRDPAVLLMRGRIEREIGEPDSALAAFRAYLAAGGDPGVGGIEMARELAVLERPESAAAWCEAALRRPLTAEFRAELRRDLRWTAAAGELAEFDAASPESVAGWVRGFWSRRDVIDARRPGARLVEQFRRYRYARTTYRLVSRHRHYDITDAFRDTSQQELDDRGVIYMRHGEPDARAFSSGPGPDRSESWLYRRPPGESDLVFHFVARGSVQDYKLVESLLDVLGFSAAVEIGSGTGPLPPAVSELLHSRSALSPVYERLARGGQGLNAVLAEERELGRRAVREGTTTDSYGLRFSGELRPVVSSFAVADSAGGELHVVFAIPAGRLNPVERDGAVIFPLALRLLVFDGAFRAMASVDTLRVFRSARSLAGGSYLTERLAARVPPGTYGFHFVVEELSSGAGALVGGREVSVPRMGSGFDASDVVIGREGSGLVWRRAEGEVALNPLQQFAAGGTASLYYEVYGLPQGAAVRTRVSVSSAGGGSVFRRLFGGRRGASLEYTTVTDAPFRSRVQQRIGLAGLPPGRYSLEVELREVEGDRRVVRREQFEIVPARRMP
jgi:tetratricopeptide (TPR) repeat protein